MLLGWSMVGCNAYAGFFVDGIGESDPYGVFLIFAGFALLMAVGGTVGPIVVWALTRTTSRAGANALALCGLAAGAFCLWRGLVGIHHHYPMSP
jgi:Na+-transporting NADH:ubiquinone oxidoreductase subunit NqrD